MAPSNRQSDPIPKLAAPGQGLPPLELAFSRLLFRGLRLAWTRSSCLRRFEREARKVLALVAQCDEQRGRQPVLAPRLIGMEDSSRYWSPFMVLEHMRIVDRDIKTEFILVPWAQ